MIAAGCQAKSFVGARGNPSRPGQKNEKKAVEYYKKAAEADCGDACNALGNCYANGQGVKKNLGKAEEYYRKGVSLDNGNSRVNLAGMIFAGDAKGDKVEADMDNGVIRNLTTGKEYKTAPFPEFIQKIIENGGLINSIANGSIK